MYYFISVIVLSMLPSGEPVLERSITGPFLNQSDCIIYQNTIQQIANETASTQMIQAECRLNTKGKVS
jgi:hypothetical protein